LRPFKSAAHRLHRIKLAGLLAGLLTQRLQSFASVFHLLKNSASLLIFGLLYSALSSQDVMSWVTDNGVLTLLAMP
jgi:hypothetical protein